MNRSGMRDDITRAWFPYITGSSTQGGYSQALKVDHRVDRSLDALRGFGEALRGSLDLVQTREQSRQAQAAEEHREHAAAFERTLT